MPNFDGEWEVRIFYATNPPIVPAIEHTHTFDVRGSVIPIAGTPFAQLDIQTKGGQTDNLENFLINDYMPLMQAFYSTTTDFIRAELWYAVEASENFSFISSRLLGLNGLSPSTDQVAQQMTMTFRSIAGGIARIQYMEHVIDSDAVENYPFPTFAESNLADFLVSPDSPVIARDNSYLNAPNKSSFGRNEALWRKRYRN